MSRPTQFRLRWKGAISGPFPLPRISEMLRSGEISLIHNIEVDEGWMTVRDYFRTIGLNRSPAQMGISESNARRDDDSAAPPTGANLHTSETMSVETGRNAAGESLERTVREGYLWCGSTFLFPPIFGLSVYAWHLLFAETPPISLFIVLCLTTAVGCFLPVSFVQKIGRTLDQEGLGEIRQAQSNLAVLLSILSLAIWLGACWLLVHTRS
jgi:hypothetical protein